MGIGTLIPWTYDQVISATKLQEVQDALAEDFVGRNTSGVPTADKNLGNAQYPWGTLHVGSIIQDGSLIDLSSVTAAAPYKVISAAVRATSNQPAYLDPAGSGNGRSLTVLATTTPINYEIAGEQYEADADISVTSLTAAPSSQNTALINQSIVTGQEASRTLGEETSDLAKYIAIGTVGTNITALDGKRAAFKVTNGGGTEYFTAMVRVSAAVSGYVLTDCYRGFFTNSSLAPMNRIKVSTGDTITLMKLGWLFLDSDGTTVATTYNEPVYSATQPTGPASGDYWYDLVNGVWKLYNGSVYAETDRLFIGWFFCDASDCLGVRCVDFYGNYQKENELTIKWDSASTVIAGQKGSRINVAGNSYNFGTTRLVWDMATHLASSADLYDSSEQASRRYYFYLTDVGTPKISDITPYKRPDLLGYYHPHNPWRCVGSCLNNASSNFLDPVVETTNDSDLVPYGDQMQTEHIADGAVTANKRAAAGFGQSASVTTNHASSSFTDVSGLSVGITAMGGKPILVIVQAANNASGCVIEPPTGTPTHIKLAKSTAGGAYADIAYWGDTTFSGPWVGGLMYLDYSNASAGSHGYKLIAKTNSGATLKFQEMQILAIELG